MIDRDKLVQQIRAQMNAVARLGGKIEEPIVEEPARESDIAAVERRIGRTLPPAMRKFFTEFTRYISVDWELPDEFSLPEPIQGISGGAFEFSLDDVVDCDLEWRQLVEMVATWEMPEISASWENKIGFYSVGNGDILAVDISIPGREPVVHLSHEGDETLHCYSLGLDFEDFLIRLVGVGCPCVDNIEPFTHDFTKPIDPDCENAVLWRKAVGLPGAP